MQYFRGFITNVTVCGLLPLKMENPDQIAPGNKTFKKLLEQQPTNESGWERVKNIFVLDEFGALSEELNSIYQGGLFGFLAGSLYGGFIHSRIAYLEFMENNQATAFKSHLDAKRKLQDKFTVNFAKGGFKWGWRVGLFTTSYLGLITCISVYRKKSSIYEYVAAGFISGAVYKFKMGLRGMAAGGIIGGALGGFGGCVSLGLMYLSGTSMEEMRYWQQQWRIKREVKVHEAMKVQEERDAPDLLKAFAKRTDEQKTTLDNIDKP